MAYVQTMDMIAQYKQAMRNYALFEGRSARREFWFYILSVFLISAVAGVLDALVGLGLFTAIVTLVHFVPSCAVAVRRLHDTDKSGWWLLLMLLPVIGHIILLVFYCTGGTKGPNRFGYDPLGNVEVVL